jgi:hypothetical protein
MSIGNLKDSGNQGNNLPWQWKVLQGLQEIANQTAQPLTCVEDSIAICAGGNLLTSTTIGADTGLDVNIIGGVTLEVNLDAADDQVGIYGYVNGAAGSPVPLNVNASGQVAIQDGGNSITVDGTVELGATTLTALENITVQNGAGAAAVNIQDGGNSITVDGGTGVSRTPNAIRPTNTSGTVTGTIYSISVANVGAANGTVLTALTTIKPGEVLNFSADAINNFFTSFDYNATGTEFIIIYVS